MLSSPACPKRFDLHGSFDAGCVMAKARPRPILWLFGQAADHRIPVHVSQLFYPLIFGEDVEVVVTGLPEGALSTAQRD